VKTAKQALADGYQVDQQVYPWIAYKGARFRPDETVEVETERETELREAATIGAATSEAIYQFLDRIERAGGATSLSGIAACHAMLTSMKKNRSRVIKLVVEPIQKAEGVRQ